MPHTDEPAVVLHETGSSRLAYFPGDIERSYWLTGHGDLLRLLTNTIRWITRDERIIKVEGDGFIEMFCWETSPGYTVHLLNYTNPDAQHGWLQSTDPLGPQTVRIKLPSNVRVRSIETSPGRTQHPFRIGWSDATFRNTVGGRLRGGSDHCRITIRVGLRNPRLTRVMGAT